MQNKFAVEVSTCNSADAFFLFFEVKLVPYTGTFFGPADRKWHTFLARGIFFVAAFGSHISAENGTVK